MMLSEYFKVIFLLGKKSLMTIDNLQVSKKVQQQQHLFQDFSSDRGNISTDDHISILVS